MLSDYMGNLPTQHGQKSICGCCRSEVFSKTGLEKQWHWAHYTLDACDTWAEPNGESMWHFKWKQYLRDNYGAETEVKIGNHRADAVMPDGMVIELQASPLDAKQIEERERFYGNMIWIYRADWFNHRHVYFMQQQPEVLQTFHYLESKWKPPITCKPAFKYPFKWNYSDSGQFRIKKPLFWHIESGQLLEIQLAQVLLFNQVLGRKQLSKFGRVMSYDSPFGRELGHLVAA